MRTTKQQQIGGGDNDKNFLNFLKKCPEKTLERKFLTSPKSRALERIFHERKYLSSFEASMLAFNLDIPTKKVVNWSQYVMSRKKSFRELQYASSNCSET